MDDLRQRLEATFLGRCVTSFVAIQGFDRAMVISSQAQVELAGGIPFIANDELSEALTEAGITGDTADEILKENEESRIAGLRASLFVLALLALLALFLTNGIPRRQPGAADPAPTG